MRSITMSRWKMLKGKMEEGGGKADDKMQD